MGKVFLRSRNTSRDPNGDRRAGIVHSEPGVVKPPRRLMNSCCERQIGHEGAKAIQCHRLETRWHRKWGQEGREGEKQWTDWGHRRWVGTKREPLSSKQRDFFRSKQLSPAGLSGLCLNGFSARVTPLPLMGSPSGPVVLKPETSRYPGPGCELNLSAFAPSEHQSDHLQTEVLSLGEGTQLGPCPKASCFIPLLLVTTFDTLPRLGCRAQSKTCASSVLRRPRKSWWGLRKSKGGTLITPSKH